MVERVAPFRPVGFGHAIFLQFVHHLKVRHYISAEIVAIVVGDTPLLSEDVYHALAFGEPLIVIVGGGEPHRAIHDFRRARAPAEGGSAVTDLIARLGRNMCIVTEGVVVVIPCSVRSEASYKSVAIQQLPLDIVLITSKIFGEEHVTELHLQRLARKRALQYSFQNRAVLAIVLHSSPCAIFALLAIAG